MDVQVHKRLRRLSARLTTDQVTQALGDPVFILSAPRSGSTLLFSILGNSSQAWTIGGESHGLFGQFPHLRAADADYSSGSLDARHADADTADALRLAYLAHLHDVAGRDAAGLALAAPGVALPGVFLEKTPRNALNIPFLLKLFPGARFILLYRDPRATIASLMEGWTTGATTGRFVTYRGLPDWTYPTPADNHWCFLLPPGWRDMKSASLSAIAAFQWAAANTAILSALEGLPRDRWTIAGYDALVADPAGTAPALCAFCGIDPGDTIRALDGARLPLSPSTVSAPSADKWRRHQTEIDALHAVYAPVWERLKALDK